LCFKNEAAFLRTIGKQKYCEILKVWEIVENLIKFWKNRLGIIVVVQLINSNFTLWERILKLRKLVVTQTVQDHVKWPYLFTPIDLRWWINTLAVHNSYENYPIMNFKNNFLLTIYILKYLSHSSRQNYLYSWRIIIFHPNTKIGTYMFLHCISPMAAVLGHWADTIFQIINMFLWTSLLTGMSSPHFQSKMPPEGKGKSIWVFF